jgi:hypothetical protein
MKKGNIISSIICILIGIFIIYATKDYPQGLQGVPGPAFFPRILSCVVIGLSILLLIKTYVKKDGRKISIFDKDSIKVYVTIGFLLAYLIILDLIGFIISTPIFLFGLIFFYVRKNPLKNAVVALVVTFIVYGIFKVLLSVPLPQGIFA